MIKKVNKNIKNKSKPRNINNSWQARGFSCPAHAEGFYYFNRKDTEEDCLEIQDYCGE